MTEPTRARKVECLHCGTPFVPRKAGHVYCRPEHRHLGPVRPEDRIVIDQAAVDRLFDPRRAPSERVRRDDWFPSADPAVVELYSADTVAARRRWYLNLKRLGRR